MRLKKFISLFFYFLILYLLQCLFCWSFSSTLLFKAVFSPTNFLVFFPLQSPWKVWLTLCLEADDRWRNTSLRDLKHFAHILNRWLSKLKNEMKNNHNGAFASMTQLCGIIISVPFERERKKLYHIYLCPAELDGHWQRVGI